MAGVETGWVEMERCRDGWGREGLGGDGEV